MWLSLAGAPPTRGAFDILADYQWRDDRGHLNGVFLVACQGALAHLEVWSIDGGTTPATLPSPNWLVSVEELI